MVVCSMLVVVQFECHRYPYHSALLAGLNLDFIIIIIIIKFIILVVGLVGLQMFGGGYCS